MPKVGLNRNFPTAVFQGPAEFGGLAHPPFYTLQGYKQIQLLMGTIRNEDDTGKLIKASLAYEQQESGYVTPIFHTSTGSTPIPISQYTPTYQGTAKPSKREDPKRSEKPHHTTKIVQKIKDIFSRTLKHLPRGLT